MEPRTVKSAADARKIAIERGLSHVKVGVFDLDGVLRGKVEPEPPTAANAYDKRFPKRLQIPASLWESA